MPAEVRDELEIVLVSNINEVFERALLGTPTSEVSPVPDEVAPVAVVLEPHEPRGAQGGAVSLPAEASEAKKTSVNARHHAQTRARRQTSGQPPEPKAMAMRFVSPGASDIANGGGSGPPSGRDRTFRM